MRIGDDSTMATRRLFPRDPIEIRRFQLIHGLSRELFNSIVRPNVHVWRFGTVEYVGEREAQLIIGRRATLLAPSGAPANQQAAQ